METENLNLIEGNTYELFGRRRSSGEEWHFIEHGTIGTRKADCYTFAKRLGREQIAVTRLTRYDVAETDGDKIMLWRRDIGFALVPKGQESFIELNSKLGDREN